MQSSKDLHLVKILSRLSNDPTSKKKSSCTKVEITKKKGGNDVNVNTYDVTHLHLKTFMIDDLCAADNVFVRKQNTKPKENMTKYRLTLTKGNYFSTLFENYSKCRI